MDENRCCKRCNCLISDLDPHSICKLCRQPDPTIFYCPDSSCEACKVIKLYQPLYFFLKKQELPQKASSPCPVNEDKISVPHTLQPNISSQSPSFIESTLKAKSSSSTNEASDDIHKLEGRLYGRILSTLLASFPDSKLSKTGHSTPKDSVTEVKNLMSLQQIDVKPKEDYDNPIVSFFKHLSTTFPSKFGSAYTDNIVNGHHYKLTTSVGEALEQSTILSSPSNAHRLREQLNVEVDDFWPSTLKDSDILGLNFDDTIPMRFHPKFRQFQSLIFGELKPTLPKDVMATSFALTTVKQHHYINFLHSREQLQKLILIFSLIDYFSDIELPNRNLIYVIKTQVEVLLNKQANHLGLVIRDIRQDLLYNAYCKDPETIQKLIHAPVHPTQFFGMHVLTLQKSIQQYGKSLRIKFKLKPKLVIPKLPSCFEYPLNPSACILRLDHYNALNKTNEDDKLIVLKTLLPDFLVRSLNNIFGNTTEYKIILDWFKRHEIHDTNIMKERQKFVRRVQLPDESIVQYANSLLSMQSKCQYSLNEMEILRDHFVFGLESNTVQQFLLQQPFWSFQQCFDYAKPPEYIKQELVEKSSPFSKPDFNGEKRHISAPKSVLAFRAFKNAQKLKSKIRHFDEELPMLKKFKHSIHPESTTMTTISEVPHEKPAILKKLPFVNQIIYDPQKWNEDFEPDKEYSYEIICPWTGIKLR